MELSRQEYPALVRSLPPTQAASVLEERIKLIGRINEDIADWLSERRRVEEAYVQGLRKLATRGPREVSSVLGVFRTPWQNIASSMESLARSHATLAQKIETDVEKPLKDYQTQNREMQAIGSIQGNLSAIAKEVESAERKAAKASGKSSNKVANATSDVESAMQSWESQAPYAFEQLQALDESRVNHLRDVLTQLETHEVDQVERSRMTAEACLNVILNVDTSEEISAFVAHSSANAPNGPLRSQPRNRAQSSGGTGAAATAAAAELPAATTTPARKQREETAAPSPFSVASSTSKMGPPPSAKKGFGGLRRLGTVLGRADKGSKIGDRPASPEKKSRVGRNPLRRGPSSRQDMQQIDSPPQPSSPKISPQAPQLGDPLISEASGLSTHQEMSPTDELSPLPNASGLTNGIQERRGPSASVVPASSPEQSQSSPQQTDAGGFSSTHSAVDDITRAQQEAASLGSDVDQSQFKLNIRDAPIREEDSAAQQTAFSSVANTLRSQAAAPRKLGTVRGRRDVRNTIFVPSGQSFENVAGLGVAPGGAISNLNASTSSSVTPGPAESTSRGSDAQSIRSAHSMSSAAPTAISHPQMQAPGLNASIVETVTTTFIGGSVSKSVVIGELALQYNQPSFSFDSSIPPSASENVRLENFPVLEKVAPNPTFITQQPARSGEYAVALSHALARPAVAFKYQVHLDEASLSSYAPLSLTPTWRIEANQASVIVQYGFNPSFTKHSSTTSSVILRNVIIVVNIDKARAVACQSKPAGIFSKDKSLIYWKLGEIEVRRGAATEQKLLARFSTEGEAGPGNVEARWEMGGSGGGGGGATAGDEVLGSGLGITQEDTATTAGGDPFADEKEGAGGAGAAEGEGAASGKWKEVPLTRRVMSGKYMASSGSVAN